MTSKQTPGHVYKTVLRCEFCDFTLEIGHSGPHYDYGKWKTKTCQNPACWAFHTARMVPSLK